MKKYLIASIALLAVVSCAKEGQAPEQAPEGGKQITISATIPTDGLTKVDFDEGASYTDGLKLTWTAGDQITVTDASNPSNTQVFTLTAGAGTASGTFTGTALAAASSYNIVYDSFGTGFNYAEQTQATDGSTAHLKYSAALTGVNSYTSFSFDETWATTNGGSFASSSVLRLRADIPFDLEDVKAVYIKSDAAIFAGGKEIKVNITTPADAGETDLLTVYAALPAGDQAIPAGTGLVVQFQVSDKEYDKYTAYRTLGAMTLKSGKVNNIGLDCNTDQDITQFANKVQDNIGTVDNPYIIGDQHQMSVMCDYMVSVFELQAGQDAVYYKVVDDIDLTGIDWIPLNYNGSYDKPINFNGGNHTISNMTVGSTYAYPSFAGVAYGTYRNVIIDKAVIDAGNSNTGVFAGYVGTGTGNIFADCRGITISNATLTATATQTNRNTGGFAGVLGNAKSVIKDCHVTGNNTISQTTTSYNGCSVAGFIGNVSVAATIEDCTAQADLQNEGSYYTGGFIGQIGAAVTPTVENCAFLGGNLTAGRSNINSPVGGFVGRIAGGAGVTITNCYVYGAHINAPNSGRCGGFVGDAGSNATANNFVSCYVTNSTISGGVNSGGFAGTYGNASKCYVESTTITANEDNAGGFIAYFEDSRIENCYTKADVVGGDHLNIGGFIGNCRKGNKVGSYASYCFANGTVSGSAESVGAFIGGVTVVPTSVTKNIGWSALPFVGSDGSFDISEAIVDNYVGTSGTISGQATTLGWDGSIWNLSGSVPTLK